MLRFQITARHHNRGAEDLSFTQLCESALDALTTVSKLREIGYAVVAMVPRDKELRQ